MSKNSIQATFEVYQKKYPMLNESGIVDKMLDDGVITFAIAKKIRSGVSLFLIDNDWSNKHASGNTLSVSQIINGTFSTKTEKPKTNFNRCIEPTFQPYTQGDCWLLSDINALNTKEWGRQAIHDAIIPDTDGSGGVTINFKGSPLKNKNIHITAQQITTARQSGNYTKEDDDMIAFELATEITFKEMVRQGLAKRTENDEYIQSMGGKYRSYIFAGITTDKFDQYPISELLGIKTKKIYINKMKEQTNAKKEIEKMMIYLSDNSANISGWCAFNPLQDYGDKNSKNYIHGGHAYAIKSMHKGKDVILIDPHYSNYEIKVSWKVFQDLVIAMTLSYKDSKTEQQFKTHAIPKNYEKYIVESDKNFEIGIKNLLEKMGISKNM